MSILSELSKVLSSCAISIFGTSIDNFEVTPAKRSEFGDFSTNIAFCFAKQIGLKPLEAAQKISTQLQGHNLIEKAEVASGGFINIFLKQSVWHDIILQIAKKKENFGFEDIGNGQKIHLEFVSANPTGPLHLGHIRGAIIFDTLAEVLKKSGFYVVREYYINDAGNQIDTLMQSIFLRYKEKITGDEIKDFPKSCYPGEYIKDVAEKLWQINGQRLQNLSEKEFTSFAKTHCLSQMIELIKRDLAKLNIFYDFFISEEDLHKKGYVEKSIQILDGKGYIATEELDKPKGDAKTWERRKQLVFLAKAFGDDENRSLQKSDGSWTYFASDLAYHLFKLERGFTKMLVGLGADHAGYVKRLKGLVSALSNGKADIDIKLYNIVNLFENSKAIKLSKRSGSIITLDDIIEKGITPDEVRFAMLTKGSDVVLDFDIAKFLQHSDDNPIFYVQYANARCSSVLKKYGGPEVLNCNIALFKTTPEWDLIKTLAKWPDVINLVVQTSAVHRIVFYAIEVAEKFHSLWNLGIKDPELRFIVENNTELTKSRIFLAQTTKCVISSVFGALKIKPVESM